MELELMRMLQHELFIQILNKPFSKKTGVYEIETYRVIKEISLQRRLGKRG